jgi:hypothetical protein
VSQKKNPPCYLGCPPFYKSREDLHVKVTRERVQGKAFAYVVGPTVLKSSSHSELVRQVGGFGGSLAAKTLGSVGRTEQNSVVRGGVLLGRGPLGKAASE